MIENPTRRASERAMRFVRNASLSLSPFIMKTNAAARLPKMATNARITKYFMERLSLDTA